MKGPAGRRAVNPDALCAYLTAQQRYVEGGKPNRRRLTINGVPVSESDARMIRRWRQGNIKGSTVPAAVALLRRYNLAPLKFAAWCAILHYKPMLRGRELDSDD
jgi:hypothetical protein